MVTRLYSVSPWGNLTGAPICALEHARVLKDSFDEVCLVLCQHGPLEERAREAGVPAWCSPFAFRGLRQGGVRKFFRHVGEVVRSRWAYVRGLTRLLKQKPGVLHIHSRAAHLPYALLAGRWARVPVVVTIHEPWAGGFEAWSELWMIRLWADQAVWLTQAMAAQHPRLLRRTSVVYNHFLVLPKRLPPQNPRPLVVMVAQMVKAKGTDLFLQVCRRLKEAGAVFEAWMVGNWMEEPEREEARRFIAANGLAGMATIQGVSAQMDEIYARMDLLLLPTRRDSFPRVVMEAMCHGIPVVATRVDGIPEMVADGETGLLVEPEDVAGFAEAVQRLLQDPALRMRMGEAGRQRAEQLFAPAKYAVAMNRIYAGLGAGAVPRGAA